MKQIKMSWLSKMQRATIKVFEEEDSDCPDYRVVKANERAIQHWLAKMTTDTEEQEKIHKIVLRQNWNTQDMTFKPICNQLREMGFTIVEGK